MGKHRSQQHCLKHPFCTFLYGPALNAPTVLFSWHCFKYFYYNVLYETVFSTSNLLFSTGLPLMPPALYCSVEHS